MNAPRGMTLIDVVVGTALVLIVFIALLGLLRASLLIASSAKAKAGATAVATMQMEYLRSLPYDSVGTVGGIPAGSVSQTATTTLNGIPYTVRTLVEYVDDAKDGSGATDTNGIPTDYKRIKVATTYTFRGTTRDVAIISNMAPPSIESTTGGGTLRINVVNAVGAGVSGASVRIENPSVVPSVDFTTFADTTGVVLLPGAPTSTDYRITVSKNGYSGAQTYARDATNQNPTPGYLTVAANQTTSSTFAIDLLSSLVLRTFSPVSAASSTDLFSDSTKLSSQVATEVVGGALSLTQSAGVYASSGSARSTTTAPTYLNRWSSVSANRSLPVGTTAVLHVTDSSGVLVPDTVLPGNATGFQTFPVSLLSVPTTTYPSLMLQGDLTTSVPAATPQVLDWTLAYEHGPTPLPNVGLTLTGQKTKGTTGAGAPIYKSVISTTTDASGVRTIPLEWDVYNLTLSGLSIVDASTTPPYTLSPGSLQDVWLILQ